MLMQAPDDAPAYTAFQNFDASGDWRNLLVKSRLTPEGHIDFDAVGGIGWLPGMLEDVQGGVVNRDDLSAADRELLSMYEAEGAHRLEMGEPATTAESVLYLEKVRLEHGDDPTENARALAKTSPLMDFNTYMHYAYAKGPQIENDLAVLERSLDSETDDYVGRHRHIFPRDAITANGMVGERDLRPATRAVADGEARAIAEAVPTPEKVPVKDKLINLGRLAVGLAALQIPRWQKARHAGEKKRRGRTAVKVTAPVAQAEAAVVADAAGEAAQVEPATRNEQSPAEHRATLAAIMGPVVRNEVVVVPGASANSEIPVSDEPGDMHQLQMQDRQDLAHFAGGLLENSGSDTSTERKSGSRRRKLAGVAGMIALTGGLLVSSYYLTGGYSLH